METKPEIDPRADAYTRATDSDLDKSYLRQLHENMTLSRHGRSDPEKQATSSDLVKEQEENIYIDFELDDPRNPLNFTRKLVQHIMC
jgi:hypothetical protein